MIPPPVSSVMGPKKWMKSPNFSRLGQSEGEGQPSSGGGAAAVRLFFAWGTRLLRARMETDEWTTHHPADGTLSFTSRPGRGQSPVTKTEPRSKRACPPGKEAATDTLQEEEAAGRASLDGSRCWWHVCPLASEDRQTASVLEEVDAAY